MSGIDGTSELKAWYEKEVRSHTSMILKVENNVYTALFINIIVVGLNAVLYAATSSGFAGYLLILLGLLIPLAGLELYRLSKVELEETFDEIIKQCKVISEEDVNEIFDVCKEVSIKMNLKLSDFSILYCKNNSYFPSILERNGSIYLIIPRNFIRLFFEKKEFAEAILAHEFAHVIQKDSDNYLFNEILVKKVKALGIVLLIISITAFVSTGFLSISMVSIVGICAFLGLKQMRLKSEELADTNVIITGHGKCLISALEEYCIEDKTWLPTHPSPQQRVSLIKEKLMKYNLISKC